MTDVRNRQDGARAAATIPTRSGARGVRSVNSVVFPHPQSAQTLVLITETGECFFARQGRGELTWSPAPLTLPQAG